MARAWPSWPEAEAAVMAKETRRCESCGTGLLPNYRHLCGRCRTDAKRGFAYLCKQCGGRRSSDNQFGLCQRSECRRLKARLVAAKCRVPWRIRFGDTDKRAAYNELRRIASRIKGSPPIDEIRKGAKSPTWLGGKEEFCSQCGRPLGWRSPSRSLKIRRCCDCRKLTETERLERKRNSSRKSYRRRMENETPGERRIRLEYQRMYRENHLDYYRNYLKAYRARRTSR